MNFDDPQDDVVAGIKREAFASDNSAFLMKDLTFHAS